MRPRCLCSHDWLEGFKKISGLWFRQVRIVGPSKTFIFGSGEGQREQYRVNLDLNLFGQRVSIITSVLEGDSTPFLLSREGSNCLSGTLSSEFGINP